MIIKTMNMIKCLAMIVTRNSLFRSSTWLHMHVLWRLALPCTVDFPPQQLPQIYTIMTTLGYTDIMFTCSLLPWYAAYSLNACQFRTMFYKLNYVESGLSRLRGGHGELPHEVLWHNLMELPFRKGAGSGVQKQYFIRLSNVPKFYVNRP